ncbi:MAG: sigma-54-dependent Fis family transcriptional regulator [Bdellovibrionales bacterium]|nr:sigma-54-dependent Fis family transcriptional regulator [Bdellovibrionales bacterium]
MKHRKERPDALSEAGRVRERSEASMHKVMVVDDEEAIRSSLRLLLRKNFSVITAEDGEDALDLIGKDQPDIILLDVMMPKKDGIETLQELHERGLEIPVIMLTAANTVRTAVQAMKYGARDYLNKPFNVEELTSLIISTLERRNEPPVPASHTKEFGRNETAQAQLIGDSAPMKDLLEQIESVASRDTTVLITGESGTGKELVAQRIHALSGRRDKPFVALNCAAIPETLIESELFGHEKGAFTSAVEKRIGHFELANGGTLFLDEIGELSLAVQVKMLRFLQEQEFFPVGRATPVRVNVRVIAATNRDLEALIREQKFRQDLFYRINVINIELPPLRDRYEDIPQLLDYFVSRFAPDYGNRMIQFDEEALSVMREYDWPGNIRELENAVESLLALAPEETVRATHLPSKVLARKQKIGCETQIFEGGMNFEEAERQFESDMILKALRRTNYVQTRAAELLGISRRILKYKMDKLGISEQGEGESLSEQEPPASGAE